MTSKYFYRFNKHALNQLYKLLNTFTEETYPAEEEGICNCDKVYIEDNKVKYFLNDELVREFDLTFDDKSIDYFKVNTHPDRRDFYYYDGEFHRLLSWRI